MFIKPNLLQVGVVRPLYIGGCPALLDASRHHHPKIPQTVYLSLDNAMTRATLLADLKDALTGSLGLKRLRPTELLAIHSDEKGLGLEVGDMELVQPAKLEELLDNREHDGVLHVVPKQVHCK